MKYTLWSVAILAGLMLTIGAGVPKTTPVKAEIGKPAPAFKLADAEGKTHSLADYKGKVVALVWTNPDCPFIQRHYREGTFTDLQKQFAKNKDVAVLFIDTTRRTQADADAATKKAAEQYKHKLTVLADLDGSVGHAYDAKHTPQAYVIDKKGNLVFAGAFDNDARGAMKPAERKVYPAEAIKAALDGKTPKIQTTPAKEIYGCSVKYPKS
jgi:peroxiredoxin